MGFSKTNYRINYNILARSQHYYSLKNYNIIEVPWIVKKEICDHTRPANKKPLLVSNSIETTSVAALVGSGEQGFLQSIYDKKLLKGRHQTITPCFRNEEVYDEYHQFNFIKNELIIIDPEDITKSLSRILVDAYDFFSIYIDKKYLVMEVTKEGYDILYKGIELGSYGYRKFEEVSWIYGTGVALPRLSQVINK